LNERYHLLEELGAGASGHTWRARDVGTDTEVAIKELSFRRLPDLKSLDLFEREVDALRSLNHDQIPTYLHHFKVVEDRHVALYLVQELVDGHVLPLTGWDDASVVDLLRQLAGVLTYLGSRSPPMIHRDVKPSNIMRRGDGSYVLIDFGSTRVALADTVGGSTVAGTLGYMAPEQLMGRADVRADIYGLGATAIALLAGDEAQNVVDPLQPGAWRAKVRASKALVELLSDMVEPRADARIATAEAVIARLDSLNTGPAPRLWGRWRRSRGGSDVLVGPEDGALDSEGRAKATSDAEHGAPRGARDDDAARRRESGEGVGRRADAGITREHVPTLRELRREREAAANQARARARDAKPTKLERVRKSGGELVSKANRSLPSLGWLVYIFGFGAYLLAIVVYISFLAISFVFTGTAASDGDDGNLWFGMWNVMRFVWSFGAIFIGTVVIFGGWLERWLVGTPRAEVRAVRALRWYLVRIFVSHQGAPGVLGVALRAIALFVASVATTVIVSLIVVVFRVAVEIDIPAAPWFPTKEFVGVLARFGAPTYLLGPLLFAVVAKRGGYVWVGRWDGRVRRILSQTKTGVTLLAELVDFVRSHRTDEKTRGRRKDPTADVAQRIWDFPENAGRVLDDDEEAYIRAFAFEFLTRSTMHVPENTAQLQKWFATIEERTRTRGAVRPLRSAARNLHDGWGDDAKALAIQVHASTCDA